MYNYVSIMYKKKNHLSEFIWKIDMRRILFDRDFDAVRFGLCNWYLSLKLTILQKQTAAIV